MEATVKRRNAADEKLGGKKILGFSLVRLGIILQQLMVGEITYFATNSLGLAAVAIAAGMGVKTAIDAVTDLIMGAVIDKTHTRWGKARPFALAGIPAGLSMIACFLIPTGLFTNMAEASRSSAMVIYITVWAILQSAVFNTIAAIAFQTHIKRAVVNDDNRIRLLTIVGVVYAIGSLALQMILPALISAFHASKEGFGILAVVIGIISMSACVVCFFLCPEYTEEELAEYGGFELSGETQKVSVFAMFKDAFQNKYLIMTTVVNFFYMAVMMSAFTVGQYYFQYVFGKLSAFTAVMATSVVIFPIYIFIPKLCRKLGVTRLLEISMFVSIAGILVRLAAPALMPAQCVGYLCVSLPNIFIASVGQELNYQCMEYGRYKTGIEAEAVYSSFVSFAQKMSTSISSVIVGVVLSASHFDALTAAVINNGFQDWAELAALGDAGFDQYVEGGAAAVQAAKSGINIAFNIIPLVFLVICVVTLHFIHIDRDLKKLRVEHGLKEDGSVPETAAQGE